MDARRYPPALLDDLSDACIHLDREGKYAYVNPTAARLLDTTPEALQGCSCWDTFARPDGGAGPHPFEEALSARQPTRAEAYAPPLQRWFTCRIYPSDDGLWIHLQPRPSAAPDAPDDAADEAVAAALHLSAEHFRALADATPQIVWILTPAGQISYLNQPGQAYFGLTERDAPVRWTPMIHPDDLPHTRQRWGAALQAGGTYEDELRLRRHDGTYRWHLVRSLPVRDAHGDLLHWCGTSTDIHDLKQSHQSLQERERLFRTMADAAPVLIWMTGPDRRYTYFNRGWLTFTGRTMEDEVGFGWTDGLHPDDAERYRATYQAAFEARHDFEIEYRLRRHDGVYRWILNHGAPHVDAQGQFSGYVGSCIDIHERKQLEQQMHLLAEAGPILSSSLDYASTLQTAATLVVPHLADWCAIDIARPDGSIQMVAVAHVDPDKVRWAHELRRRYPVDPHASRGVAHVIRTGTSEFYPHVTDEQILQAALDEEHLRVMRAVGYRSALVVPLHARGQTLGALTLVWSDSDRHYSEEDLHFAEELARRAAIVVDNARLYQQAREAQAQLQTLNTSLEARVAERTETLAALNRQLRDEVAERQRIQQTLAQTNTTLEQRNRELQDFAYVASHDLQEPLRKIRTFAKMLESEYAPRLEEGAAYVERIRHAAERMTTLIRELLAFSRIATQEQHFEEVDLQALVDEVLTDLEVRIAETGGQVETEALCALPADPLQLRQLLQNLIGNALKFHREGVPPEVRIRAHTEDDLCHLEIEDNGIGFEEKYLDRIFSPFQRLHGQSAFPGTGMGLAICRRIVERHGGRITAHSTPGAGSTFVITLPAVR